MKTRTSKSVTRRDHQDKPSSQKQPPHIADQVVSSTLLDLIRLRVAQIHQQPLCIKTHADDLRAQNVPEERIDQLSHWQKSPLFTKKERAALALSESISLDAKKPMSASLLMKAKRHFNKKQMIALTLAIMAVNDWNYLAGSL